MFQDGLPEATAPAAAHGRDDGGSGSHPVIFQCSTLAEYQAGTAPFAGQIAVPGFVIYFPVHHQFKDALDERLAHTCLDSQTRHNLHKLTFYACS